MDMTDHVYKKNLRAHRRTVSSNLEHLCAKTEPKETLLNKEVSKDNGCFLGQERKSVYKGHMVDSDHEVVKLLKASTDMFKEKRIIVDSIEVNQQNKGVLDSYGALQSSRESAYFPKDSQRYPDAQDFRCLDSKSFKKKASLGKPEQKPKQAKRKNLFIRKPIDTPSVRSEYYQLYDFPKVRRDKEQNAHKP